MRTAARPLQTGSVIVEFALAFMLFWTALIAVIEISLFMFSWGTAHEATRLAVRLASICDMGSTQETKIRLRVKALVESSGQIDLDTRTDWLSISYFPDGCSATTCRFVEAKLQGIHPDLLIPGLSETITLPEFRIRSPRESMRNTITSEPNATCS
jgi:hypothetical protein